MIRFSVTQKGLMLRAESDYTGTALLRRLKGGLFDRTENVWYYPIATVLHVFETLPVNTFEYTEEVYQAFDDQRKAKRWLKETALAKDFVPPVHEFLMPHQVLCLEIAKRFSRFALNLDTGTGKTLTALAIIKEKRGKWLVLSPKSIIRTGWYKDQLDFYPDIKMLPLSVNFKRDELLELNAKWGNPLGLKGNEKPRRASLIERMAPFADVLVINPESFMKYTDVYQNVNGLIVDESTVVKNPNSGITKNVTKFVRGMEYVYTMSGLPAPNSRLDYFSQMRLIDASLFGQSYYRFRGKYFIASGYMNKVFVFNQNKIQEFAELLSHKAITLKKQECLDLPERTDVLHEITLPPAEMKIYKEMLRHRIIDVAGGTVEANNKTSVVNKLRQLLSGFIIDTDTGTTYPIGIDSKIQELKEVLTLLGDEQVIIWINYKEEARVLDKLLGDKAVTAYSGTKNLDESIRKFQQAEAQYIIAHPATLKYGVTFTGNRMVRNCTYAIYFSMNYNYEDYYQSRDRIYRKGQTEKVTYIHFLTADTVDTIIYNNLRTKGSNVKLLDRIIKEFTT